MFSACTFEDPNQPSPTYSRKTTSTRTTLTPSSTSTLTVSSTSTISSNTGSTTSTESTTTSTLGENTYKIIAQDNKFTPEELRLSAGEEVRIILENWDPKSHTLMNEELKINWHLPYRLDKSTPSTRNQSFNPTIKGSFYLEDKNVNDMYVKLVVE
ncbi:MAG: hypothetical protein B6U97_01600 [Candidatus Altiarchaeales archaeon ex4484_96]|nr:MAG: hypothetical protein B6U97_01600 [Candidatus Altiarchaeales archaeon ex4484_96]